MPAPTLADAVSQFGAAAKAKLSGPVTGEPEDQLRNPLEQLIAALSPLSGLSGEGLTLIGETSLADLQTRPDFSVTRGKALIGFIEVKAPGKGSNPEAFPAKSHDRQQWEKLKALPNLIYTDGNAFTLCRDGAVLKTVHLLGDVKTSGSALAAPDDLLNLISDFVLWSPVPPRTPRQLAEVSARLCRLLRDEVAEQLARGAPALTSLKTDWQKLLFPEADAGKFADGYAQAVTFGLLMAKARGLSLKEGIEPAAKLLRKSNTLIGSALRLLTEEVGDDHSLDTSLKTLSAVLDVVDWSTISKDEPEAWLYFYELFLQQYDKTLRKQTGSYYTPPEVVTAMVRLVHEALQSRFGLPSGFASSEVAVADPAVGTGTFLLGVLRRIADTVEADQGEGAVSAAVADALKRLIGFEIQFGPFAVAQLRLLAEIVDLSSAPSTALRVYVADTLSDPDEETAWIPTNLEGIAESRRAANRVKRHEAITVVIGNPPYKEKAKGRGGWVEDRGPSLPSPLDDWQPPRDWGVGAHAKHLRNLYVYFWRWAAWKVFGGDPFHSGTEAIDPNWTKRRGVVCFITVAGFLNGPGFQKMRADLRRDADEIWVIDCSPEGHQPPQATRIFQGVQQPVCIVMAARRSADADPHTPARVRFRALPEGGREEKFAALAAVELEGDGWTDAPDEWRAPFLPAGAAAWESYPALEDLFIYNGSGVMAGRTWVIAPDAESLKQRWRKLISEKDSTVKEKLFHPQLRDGRVASRHVRKQVSHGLGGETAPVNSIADETSMDVKTVHFAFRSFDRQFLVRDIRVLNDARPILWSGYSSEQAFITAPSDQRATAGPALTIASLIPDLHHYNGRGGRAFPLWADSGATQPNISNGLLKELRATLGGDVSIEDVFAYIAAVAASPAYTERFRADLKQPGLRIPLTADRALFDRAVALGREVVWLHTFGERFGDDRPAGPPRASPNGPTIPKDGALPTTLAAMPHELTHDAAERRLKIGTGYIDNVAPEVWAYEVSGKRVLSQWWSYRREDRSKPPMGDRRPPSKLSLIQPTDWPAEYTTELLNVLHVLTRLVALEPAQAALLGEIVEGPLIGADALRAHGGLSGASAENSEESLDDVEA